MADRIVRRIPDLPAERAAWAGRSVLLVGAASRRRPPPVTWPRWPRPSPAPRLVWAVRAAQPDWGEVPDDPLPQRKELVEVAERLHGGARQG